MLSKSLVCFWLGLCCVCGCSSDVQQSKARAIGLAKKEALRQGMRDGVVDSCDLMKDGHWLVGLTRPANAPGGFAAVEISADGRVVIRYARGR